MHVMILGRTMNGKTTLAARLSEEYKKRGYGVIVLDPMLDRRWSADFVTADKHVFMDMAKRSFGCFLFIDESAQTVGHYDQEFFWLATQSRHWGHAAHFISQRGALISPTVRGQCGKLFLFASSLTDAKVFADEFGKPDLKQAPGLAAGEYFEVGQTGGVSRHRLTLA